MVGALDSVSAAEQEVRVMAAAIARPTIFLVDSFIPRFYVLLIMIVNNCYG
jgi:hypothetical protein